MKNCSLLLLLFILSINYCFSQEKIDVFEIARKGTIDQAKEVIKTNPNAFKVINSDGYPPLILACYRGNIEVAKFLIDNVKDIDYNTGMGTALMGAIFKDQIELIKLLLNKKANVDAQDANGGTALMLAVQGANQEIIKLLLERKANKAIKNNDGKTAFEIAVFAGNEAIINLLK